MYMIVAHTDPTQKEHGLSVTLETILKVKVFLYTHVFYVCVRGSVHSFLISRRGSPRWYTGWMISGATHLYQNSSNLGRSIFSQ